MKPTKFIKVRVYFKTHTGVDNRICVLSGDKLVHSELEDNAEAALAKQHSIIGAVIVRIAIIKRSTGRLAVFIPPNPQTDPRPLKQRLNWE